MVSRNNGLRWWQFGLIGAMTLSLATAAKFVRAIIRGAVGKAEWGDAAAFAAAIFGMGFVCGIVVWAGRGLHDRIGAVGDSIVGAVVMLVFFAMCMLIFDPDLLGPKFESGGVWMLNLALLGGAIFGPMFGRDLRKG
jgi:hypothetical protein